MIDTVSRRLTIVSVVLVVVGGLLLARLVALQFQLDPEVAAYFLGIADSAYRRRREVVPPRGLIYDRDGNLLATNMIEYEVGISPALVSDRTGTAILLAELLDMDEVEVLDALDLDDPWVLLARPVPAVVGEQLESLDLPGVSISPIQRRFYPQGALAAHVLGFVGLDGHGYYGVEGYYQDRLAGRTTVTEESEIPFERIPGPVPRPGADLVLTIDREVQYLAEQTLMQAIVEHGAQRGTIIIMNPRTGEILALAVYPNFDPNDFYEAPHETLVNIAISEQYEPGSVFKVLTMAVALENGIVTPESTYYDEGQIEVGGRVIYNWDRRAYGLTTMTEVLARSLNVGTATLSVTLGPTRFYTGLRAFGIGLPTGVDMEGEAAGELHQPGDPIWSESDLGTNSFGQGLAVTPIQLLTAINAVANDGLMMHPHVLYQMIDGDRVYTSQPSAIGRPISAQTAHELTDMMVATVEHGIELAQVPGYTVAGKTGTAEIPGPAGYEEEATIVSFVGFLPAYDPQVSILIRLDRPTSSRWGSQVAAPVFSELARRLVVLLDIPPDDVRQQLLAAGGVLP